MMGLLRRTLTDFFVVVVLSLLFSYSRSRLFHDSSRSVWQPVQDTLESGEEGGGKEKGVMVERGRVLHNLIFLLNLGTA